MARMKLYGEPGWGSTLIDAQLAWYGIEHDFEPVGDLFQSEDARRKVLALNPLGQIPTLVLPDGRVMTESAAITLHLADVTGNSTLVPAPADPERPTFLRFLIFFVANVYPTYTYADDPARFVAEASAQQGFKDAVTEYAKKLYSTLEHHAGAPWFLGERFSALDIYVCTMTHWRPGRAWFDEHAPKLAAIADAAEQVPQLKDVWRRNFG